MNEYNEYCMFISQTAVKAMLYEVSATPKPGLVDRINSGAHRDMDFFSFMASSSVMPFTFYKCALAGYEYEETDLKGLLEVIRPIGIAGEKVMYNATFGVNTHKGLIFSLGVICAAIGYNYRQSNTNKVGPEAVFSTVKKMTEGITERELQQTKNKEKQTYGEHLYKELGIKGIRGEVEAGFPTVMRVGLPIFKKLVKEKTLDFNDMLVQTLLYIMAEAEDSNVIGRNGLEALEYVRASAGEVLKAGGMTSAEGRKAVRELDEDFIKRNISPGGSADLLAVTVMLHFMMNE